MMRTTKLFVSLLVISSLILINGCVSEQQYNDLRIQNDTQRKRLAELESQVQAMKLQAEKLNRQLATAQGRGNIETDALRQKLAAIEEDLANKKTLLARLQHQLLYGGVQLPVELNTMLEDFAKSSDMVTYDSNRGVVKFKSDLLFEPGSDVVAPEAREAVKSLCIILNSEQGRQFDIIVAGHTDDLPIARPATREKHPTNWHLSAHRAISVMNVMADNKVSEDRLSIRGFGEFRPVAPNKPDKKGNPLNRRVEIYIVPKGL